MRIDAHHHFWALNRGGYDWIDPNNRAIYRDFGPKDLAPLLHANGCTGTILVQADPTEEETNFLLGIATRTDFVLGVVGWTDFESATVAAQIRYLSDQQKLVGLRPMIQDIQDPNWMLRRELEPALEALIACDLSLDALIRPHHLRNLIELSNRYPNLRIVIDHAAKPDIANGAFEPWATSLAELAQRQSIYCKLSGLATEAKPNCSTAEFRRYTDHILSAFGPKRVIWGSDWPVCNIATNYHDWFSTCEELLKDLNQREKTAVFGENAIEFYQLDTEHPGQFPYA